MFVSLIAAVADDLVIGSASGRIPWDLPRDRAHFRARTAGKWLLVGRRTYLEMEGWFGDRTPLVLTRDPEFRPFRSSHRRVASPAEAIETARANGAGELLVCGGAAVFEITLPFANRLLLTRVDLTPEVTEPVHFPDFSASGVWALRHVERWPAGDVPIAARFEVHERIRK